MLRVMILTSAQDRKEIMSRELSWRHEVSTLNVYFVAEQVVCDFPAQGGNVGVGESKVQTPTNTIGKRAHKDTTGHAVALLWSALDLR